MPHLHAIEECAISRPVHAVHCTILHADIQVVGRDADRVEAKGALRVAADGERRRTLHERVRADARRPPEELEVHGGEARAGPSSSRFSSSWLESYSVGSDHTHSWVRLASVLRSCSRRRPNTTPARTAGGGNTFITRSFAEYKHSVAIEEEPFSFWGRAHGLCVLLPLARNSATGVAVPEFHTLFLLASLLFRRCPEAGASAELSVSRQNETVAQVTASLGGLHSKRQSLLRSSLCGSRSNRRVAAAGS